MTNLMAIRMSSAGRKNAAEVDPVGRRLERRDDGEDERDA